MDALSLGASASFTAEHADAMTLEVGARAVYPGSMAPHRGLRRPVGATAVVAFLLAGCAFDPSSQEDRAASTAILNAAVDFDDKPGCSAAVGVDGRIVWAEARGIANLDTAASLEPSTPMHIASVSKQFTAMAILMLVEQGTLTLDDSPAEHLDGMPTWAEGLTLRSLMHHTSGITDFLSVADRTETFGPAPITNADILEFVRTSPVAQKGSSGSFDYSNTNYTLLADTVTEVTGVPFTEWMQATVFEPLDLEMRFWPALASDAAGHVTGPGGFSVVEAGPWTEVGAGGIYTTPSELVRWADHIRESSLVRAETFNETLADAVEVSDEIRYGPGLGVSTDGLLLHPGDGEGEVAHFEVSADRHTTVAVACNQKNIDPAGMAADLQGVWGDSAAGG